MFRTHKSAMALSFSNFDFFADLQGRFGRFVKKSGTRICIAKKKKKKKKNEFQ